MYRRRLLRLAATLWPLGLAGCAGDDGSSGGETSDTTSPSLTPTSTSTSTPTPIPTSTQTPPGIEEAKLSVQDIESGQQVDEATVTLEDDAVVVTGTVWGSDGCKTATLAAAEYDAETDTLSIAVATTDRKDVGDLCTQTLVEIDYCVRITFSRGFPGTVVVTHDGRAVTTVVTS